MEKSNITYLNKIRTKLINKAIKKWGFLDVYNQVYCSWISMFLTFYLPRKGVHLDEAEKEIDEILQSVKQDLIKFLKIIREREI